jgi:drug/metabolite transporter (DMT)-like permease
VTFDDKMEVVEKKDYRWGILLTIIGSIFFSTKAIFVKLGLKTGSDSVTLLGLRMLSAFPFYMIFLLYAIRKNKLRALSSKDWLKVIMLGILGYYLASLLDFIGLSYINASLERLILFTYPTMVLILGRIFYHRAIHPIQLVAVIICYLGLGLAFIGDMHIAYTSGLFIGLGFVLMSALTYAYYLVSSDSLIAHIGSSLFTALSLLVSSMAVFVHVVIAHPFSLKNIEKETWYYGLALGIIATVIPTFSIAAGIKKIGSANASLIASIGPVSTTILAGIFLDEKLTVSHIIGTVLVLVGVMLIGGYKVNRSNA